MGEGAGRDVSGVDHYDEHAVLDLDRAGRGRAVDAVDGADCAGAAVSQTRLRIVECHRRPPIVVAAAASSGQRCERHRLRALRGAADVKRQRPRTGADRDQVVALAGQVIGREVELRRARAAGDVDDRRRLSTWFYRLLSAW